MRTTVMLSITLFSVLMFTTTAFYCGNYPYNTVTQQCMCDNGSCCAPELYPNNCCQNSTFPLPVLGEWILVDTNDPNNMVNAELPLTISYQPGVPYVVQVPWLNIQGGPQTITYNFTIQFECNYENYLSHPNDPTGYLMTLYVIPPYFNISMSYNGHRGYFLPLNQTKLDLIS